MTAMTLIEGVGDEVTAFFLLTVLAVLAVLAWWTTQVVDRPLRIQTIIVGQRVIHVQGEPAGAEPAAEEAADPAGDSGADDSATGQAEDECDDDSAGTGHSSTGETTAAETEPAVEAAADSAETPAAPVAVAEEAPAAAAPLEQADAAVCPPSDQQIRQRRLVHFQPSAGGTAASAGAAVSSRAGEHTAAEAAPESAAPAPGSEEEHSADPEADRPSSDGRSIMVKLKFLNDTQRLVEGSRQEALADFKRRHFPAETAANHLVRLIFNGRLLPDQETLAQCGFYHNCVVHCHVSAQPRPAPAAAAAASAGPADEQPDLGVLMLPALTSVLTLVWGLRLRYPEMFSSLASGLLVVLTLLLAVFAAGAFLPLQRLTAAVAQRRQQRRGR